MVTCFGKLNPITNSDKEILIFSFGKENLVASFGNKKSVTSLVVTPIWLGQLYPQKHFTRPSIHLGPSQS
jgi:hypothetical protein